MTNERALSRRDMMKTAGATAALAAVGVGSFGIGTKAEAAGNGFGLNIVDQGVFGRMRYFRFSTNEISYNPAVNVLVPDDYDSTWWRRYPVLYLHHGGQQDFRKFDFEDDIRGLTAGRKLIVVMPDGGQAGWFSNPVSTNVGPRNYESFHMNQLVPWIDANFRTFAEYNGRAVSGFSMGGFGALKYAAKYYGHFASVSSHSGPASLRRDWGTVAHWANASSAAVELGGGTIYGAPFWDQGRVNADNPVQRIESYRNKRIFLVCGTAPDINEDRVRPGQQEFRWLLGQANIPHEWYELPGGHFVRRDMLQRDIDGVIGRLRQAG